MPDTFMSNIFVSDTLMSNIFVSDTLKSNIFVSDTLMPNMPNLVTLIKMWFAIKKQDRKCKHKAS